MPFNVSAQDVDKIFPAKSREEIAEAVLPVIKRTAAVFVHEATGQLKARLAVLALTKHVMTAQTLYNLFGSALVEPYDQYRDALLEAAQDVKPAIFKKALLETITKSLQGKEGANDFLLKLINQENPQESEKTTQFYVSLYEKVKPYFLPKTAAGIEEMAADFGDVIKKASKIYATTFSAATVPSGASRLPTVGRTPTQQQLMDQLLKNFSVPTDKQQAVIDLFAAFIDRHSNKGALLLMELERIPTGDQAAEFLDTWVNKYRADEVAQKAHDFMQQVIDAVQPATASVFDRPAAAPVAAAKPPRRRQKAAPAAS